MTEAEQLRAMISNALTTHDNTYGSTIRLYEQLNLLKSWLLKLDFDNLSLLVPRIEQAADNLASITQILVEVEERLLLAEHKL